MHWRAYFSSISSQTQFKLRSHGLSDSERQSVFGIMWSPFRGNSEFEICKIKNFVLCCLRTLLRVSNKTKSDSFFSLSQWRQSSWCLFISHLCKRLKCFGKPQNWIFSRWTLRIRIRWQRFISVIYQVRWYQLMHWAFSWGQKQKKKLQFVISYHVSTTR